MAAIKIFIILSLFSTYSFAENQVVATVNDATITADEFKRAYQQNMMFVTDKIVTKQSVLENLIHKKLGIQKAKKAGLQNNPIIKNKMEDVLFNAQISKDLEGELAKIKITDKDIKSYYRSQPEYRTAHILLRVRPQPAKAELMAALEQTKKIYQRLLKKPELFAELANRFSQASTGPNG